MKFPQGDSDMNTEEDFLALPWAETEAIRKDCLPFPPAGVCSCRQCPAEVNGEYCSLQLKIAKGLGWWGGWGVGGGEEGSIGEKENSTKLACNYTKVIDCPQRGGVGVTESPEYLIKCPPTYCIHHSHPENLRCCRYDHIPNYRVTGQAAGGRKQPQTFSKGTNKHELFSLFLRLALLWHRHEVHAAFQ